MIATVTRMEATLTFDLTDPDDIDAHLKCVMAAKLAGALFEITHNLKKKCEHTRDAKPDIDCIELVFDQIHQVCEERNININEL